MAALTVIGRSGTPPASSGETFLFEGESSFRFAQFSLIFRHIHAGLGLPGKWTDLYTEFLDSPEWLCKHSTIGRYGNLPYVGRISLSAESLRIQFTFSRYGNLPYIVCRPYRVGRISLSAETLRIQFILAGIETYPM